MKGKSTFTKKEAEVIKKLIHQKQVANRETQKSIREEIRKLGFFITDFSNKKRYTAESVNFFSPMFCR
jgi:CTP:phosphocholine cytidylyltransferase-like protein